VAEVWDRAENADAQIAAIQCHIKGGCHATNKLARSAGLK